MKTLNRIATDISRIMYVIAGVALAGIMFLTVADVILRTFKRPIVGTYDLVGLLGAVVIGFALPQTSRTLGHVIMDFVTSKLPSGLQVFLRIVTRIFAICLFVIIGWNMFSLGNDYWVSGEVTPTLELPMHPVCYGIAVACAVECLVLIIQMFEKRDEES
ncbi:MAG: TRAP transporter small permease [Desulfomonilaceae bacterium]